MRRKLALVDCYGFKIEGNKLRLTLHVHESAYVDLKPHCDLGRILRSVTLTTRNLNIAYSKEVGEIEKRGLMGIDSNLDNITTASSDDMFRGSTCRSQTNQGSLQRGQIPSKEKRREKRRRLFGKYGTLQRNRIGLILNNVSASVVKQAKENGSA
jgi:hypothetical protein